METFTYNKKCFFISLSLLLVCCLHIDVVGAQVFKEGGIDSSCESGSQSLSTRLKQMCHLMETSAETLMSEQFNRRCHNFISPDGTLGEWGLLVLDSIEEVGPSCFYEKMRVDKLCPKYHSMAFKNQAKFWVWVFASISQVESSCREKVRAWGVYGWADGLMQLEYSYKLRKSSGRDKKFCRTYGPTDSSAPLFQFQCAASILRDVHCVKNRTLSYRGGYWEKLRGTKRNISKLIKQFSACQ